MADKPTLHKLFGYWLPVVVWCSVIFYLSSIQNLSTRLRIDFVLRKMAHVTEYCVLFLLSNRALKNSFGGWKNSKVYFISALFSVIYAASDEFHQSFVPTRGPSIVDVGIDSVGVAAGMFVLSYYNKIKVRKNAS